MLCIFSLVSADVVKSLYQREAQNQREAEDDQQAYLYAFYPLITALFFNSQVARF